MSKWYEVIGGEWSEPYNSLQELLYAITDKRGVGRLTPHNVYWLGCGKFEITFVFTPVFPPVAGEIVIRAVEVSTTP
jgi:hypothetical protein